MNPIERAENVLDEMLAVATPHMMQALVRISGTADLLRARGPALDAGQWDLALAAIETESRDLANCLRHLARGLVHPVEGRW